MSDKKNPSIYWHDATPVADLDGHRDRWGDVKALKVPGGTLYIAIGETRTCGEVAEDRRPWAAMTFAPDYDALLERIRLMLVKTEVRVK